MKQNAVTPITDISNDAQATEDPQIIELVNELKKDGLITSDNYSVSVKDGRLYINDIKQTNTINNKYKKIFADKDDFTYEVKVDSR
jgi:hypothetical protein